MIAVVLSFLVGVASSAFVGWFVYRRQRNEALTSEATLLLQISKQMRLAGVAASTGIINLSETKRLKRDVELLRRQLGNASNAVAQTDDLPLVLIDLKRLWDGGALDMETLLRAHVEVLGDEIEFAGKVRDVDVALGGDISDARGAFLPPPPEAIDKQLGDLLASWRRTVEQQAGMTEDQTWDALASFYYGLLRIHPFLDGNGLVARALLAIQAERLLGISLFVPRVSAEHLRALRAANRGDLDPLKAFLKTCVAF
ncbi:MAG: Fic family protein [Acidobacteriaceae bacterium]|jgi:fido (protein-threonine AMPylation protein)